MTAIRLPTTDVTDIGNPPGAGGPLRAGGRALPASGSSDAANLPSTLSGSAAKQRPALQIVRDLWEGNDRLHEATTTYLPKAPAEDPVNYRVRLERAVLFNVFANTIKGIVGFIFRVSPELGEDVPAQIAQDWENIDLAGTHGDVFARDIAVDAQTAGHAAILVEYPNTGGVRLSLADEAPLRPYWVPIKKDNILSWRTTIDAGRTVLTQLVLKECHMVPDGAFGEKEETHYRVLYRENGVVGWQLLYIDKNKNVAIVGEGLYPTQDEIPVAEVPTAGRCGLFESDPPLLDLAYLNLAHYRQWSDYDTSIHLTCVPILFTSGFLMKDDQGNEIQVGPNAGLNSENPDGKAAYVSHGGEALAACKASLDDLENRMASLGLAAMATSKRAAETATAKEIDKGATDATMATTSRGLQDGIERAFGFHAKYYGLPSGGSVEVNRDFDEVNMPADLLTAYVGAVANAGLPVSVLLKAMQEGGLIAPDVDIAAMEAEIMSNQAAIEEQKQIDMQAQLDAKANGAPGAFGK